jgi:hypothetical protein
LANIRPVVETDSGHETHLPVNFIPGRRDRTYTQLHDRGRTAFAAAVDVHQVSVYVDQLSRSRKPSHILRLGNSLIYHTTEDDENQQGSCSDESPLEHLRQHGRHPWVSIHIQARPRHGSTLSAIEVEAVMYFVGSNAAVQRPRAARSSAQ